MAASVTLRQYSDQRLTILRGERYSWFVHWLDLGKYLLPRRTRYLVTPNATQRGLPINNAIIDSTGSLAVRTLAAGMMSGIASPARPWFRLTLDNQALADQSEVKVWLDEVQRRMLRVFANSNFYLSMAVLFEDLSVFGTAAMVMHEDAEDIIRCYNPAIGEYFLAQSYRLQVDTLYREFTMSARQLVQEFGLDKVSAAIKAMVEQGRGGQDKEIIVCHAIEPNDTSIVQTKVAKSFRYREVFWERGSGEDLLLDERGYHEFPVLAPRWHLSANDVYGRSPGMDALGDVKQLQLETKRKAQAIDKMVNPPVIADVTLKNEPTSLLPGGVTYVPSTQGAIGVKPIYEVKPDLSHMVADIAEVQRRIKEVFFCDLFLMISQLETVRTATEISARREEKLVMLGPVLERFENEALDPAVERTFAIMARLQLLPPAPAAIQGQRIQVQFVSMLADAQRAVATTGFERWIALMGNLAAVHPEILDNINFDESSDWYADALGVSPKLLNSDPVIAAMRKARAQQQAAAQAAQLAAAAAQSGKVLSETDVGGGQNALQLMMGGREAA